MKLIFFPQEMKPANQTNVQHILHYSCRTKTYARWNTVNRGKKGGNIQNTPPPQKKRKGKTRKEKYLGAAFWHPAGSDHSTSLTSNTIWLDSKACQGCHIQPWTAPISAPCPFQCLQKSPAHLGWMVIHFPCWKDLFSWIEKWRVGWNKKKDTEQEIVGKQTSFGTGLHDGSWQFPRLSHICAVLYHPYTLQVSQCWAVCPKIIWEYSLCCMDQGWRGNWGHHYLWLWHTLSPCWPGTLTMALWSMICLPLLLVFVRMKPASLMKINLYGITLASLSNTFWKQIK